MHIAQLAGTKNSKIVSRPTIRLTLQVFTELNDVWKVLTTDALNTFIISQLLTKTNTKYASYVEALQRICVHFAARYI